MNDSPRVLGNRYEVGELLGRGGMAEVHLGRDARLGRTVAIKLLRSDLARDSTFQARFRREAQSSAALNHPSIVAVYDTGEEQVVDSGGGVFNLPYIVMEHIEGRTLRDVLAEGHHLDVDSALDIITGVLAALEYSHRIGIVHRDIKPANVMLTPVGDVKVMDFGIARAMSDASSTMTQTQAVIGTAQYLSPEQARGEQVDTRSDLYSAGCLLYELLTGRPPFVADSPVAVAYQHVREAPIPPSHLVPGIPDSVDRITLHSLAKGRDERYQTAADFRSDVEAARGGRQISAVPAMHGSNATTQYVPVQDPTGTRIAPAMGAGGALLGGTMAGQGNPNDPYNQYGQPDPYGQANPYQQAEQYNTGGDQYGNDPYGRRSQREQEEPASNWKMIVAGIAVVLVVALIGYFVAQSFKADDTTGNSAAANIEVPDVVKQLAAKATAELKTAGFTDVTTKKVPSSEDEEGKVTKQDPEAGQSVAKTTPIVLSIGNGPNVVEVPALAGKSESDARAALEEVGLTLGNVTEQDSTSTEEGKIFKQSPAKGESVDPKSAVDVVVSTGMTTVPELYNKTEAQAKNLLKKAGLKVKVQTEPAEVDDGRVSRSTPEEGSRQQLGSTVTIFIAKTPVTTEPPTPDPTETTPTPTETTDQGGFPDLPGGDD